MEIPLVVGKNKCVIVSSSPYTRVNHMPEMLWARPHCKWHGCEPGEATTTCPALGLGRASCGLLLSPHHPPPISPHGPPLRSHPSLNNCCEWKNIRGLGVLHDARAGEKHPGFTLNPEPSWSPWVGLDHHQPWITTIVPLLPRWASSPTKTCHK